MRLHWKEILLLFRTLFLVYCQNGFYPNNCHREGNSTEILHFVDHVKESRESVVVFQGKGKIIWFFICCFTVMKIYVIIIFLGNGNRIAGKKKQIKMKHNICILWYLQSKQTWSCNSIYYILPKYSVSTIPCNLGDKSPWKGHCWKAENRSSSYKRTETQMFLCVYPVLDTSLHDFCFNSFLVASLFKKNYSSAVLFNCSINVYHQRYT